MPQFFVTSFGGYGGEGGEAFYCAATLAPTMTLIIEVGREQRVRVDYESSEFFAQPSPPPPRYRHFLDEKVRLREHFFFSFTKSNYKRLRAKKGQKTF